MEDTTIKLKRYLYTVFQNKIEKIRGNGKIFEIIAAARLEEFYMKSDVNHHYQSLLWDDINPDVKDDMRLPQKDVGVDYVLFMNGFPTLFGQSKDYAPDSYVASKDLDRTRLCYYHANNSYYSNM